MGSNPTGPATILGGSLISRAPSFSNLTFVTVTSGGPPPSGLSFVLVAMENEPYDLVLGDGINGSPNAPFLASLVSQGATIPHYNGGFAGSSESNYVALVGDDTYGSSNGTRNIGDCSTRTIVRPLRIGSTEM